VVIVEMGSSQGYFRCFMSLRFFLLSPSIVQFSTLMVVADLQISGKLQFVWFHKMIIHDHDHDDLKCNTGLFLIPIWIQKPTKKYAVFGSCFFRLQIDKCSDFPFSMAQIFSSLHDSS
jgi:hypothetical protein